METHTVILEHARDPSDGKVVLTESSGVEVYNTTGWNERPEELWGALSMIIVAFSFL